MCYRSMMIFTPRTRRGCSAHACNGALDTVNVRENDNVGTLSTRMYRDVLHLAKALEDEAHVGLEGGLANVMVVAKDSKSVACS